MLDIIKFNFELVQITPGDSQQAEEIFESVNATGRKLSEFDYLRNNLFLRARDKSDEFYKKYWNFENDPDDYDWSEDKLESFFQAFLIAKLGPDILENDAKLFDVYHDNLKEKDVENEFRELEAYAKTYKHLDNENPKAHFKEQMQFYTDLSTFYDNKNDYNPGIRLLNYNNIILVQAFILHLVHKKGISYPKEQENLDQEELKQVFRVLESYTTRRLLMDTIIGRYAYQQIINYFRQISSGDLSNSEFSISKLVENLAEVKTRKWIPDVEIKNLFQNSRRRYIRIYSPYFQVGLRFTERYIFYRIENWMRKNDGKELLNFNEFPDKLERIQYGKDLNHSMWNSIGNTIFCQRGRGGYTIRSFDDEKRYLKEEGKGLLINKMIYDCPKWGKNQIENREKKLLKGFQEIWPESWVLMIESPLIVLSYEESRKSWVPMILLDPPSMSYEESRESSEINTLDKSTLFVCSSKSWQELDSSIKIVDHVRRKQLRLQQQSEQLNIKNEFFKFAREKKAAVSLVTRSGHLLEGMIKDIYKDVICMEIKEHLVIVFKTGLLEFEFTAKCYGVVKDWGPNDLYGSIEYESLSRVLPQEIEVKSEFLDESILSGKLLPNVKVNFDLNIVQKNGHLQFQAHNVKPITTGRFHRGKIKSFRPEKGSGFLEPDDHKEDIYINKSQVPSEDRNLLKVGQQVEFNIAETIKGQNVAINVTILNTHFIPT